MIKRFTKRQWKALRIIAPAEERRAQIRADSQGDMWLWQRTNGHHIWASHFDQFPWRNDLHRIMSMPASYWKKPRA